MVRTKRTADIWDENSTRNENKENLLCMNGRRLGLYAYTQYDQRAAHAYADRKENSKRTQKIVKS